MSIPAVPSNMPTDMANPPSNSISPSDNTDSFAQALNQASQQQNATSNETKTTSNTPNSGLTRHSQSTSKSGSDSKPSKTSSKSDKDTKSTDTKSTDTTVNPVATAGSNIDVNNAANLPTIVAPTDPQTAPPVAVTPASNTTIDIKITDPAVGNNKLAATSSIATEGPTSTGTDASPVTGTPNLTTDTKAVIPDPGTLGQAIAQTVTNQVSSAAAGLGTSSPADNASKDAVAGKLSIDTAQNAASTLVNSMPNVSTNPQVATTGSADISTPVPTSPLTQQIVSVIQPLRQQSGDGNYNLTLQLHPESLGKVEVTVQLHNGEISMQLSSDNADSRQLLRDSMNDLRQQLESSGLSTGSLDVGTGDTTDRQFQSAHGSNAHGLTDDDEMSDADFFSRLATAMPTNPSDGSLDVRV